MNLLTRSFPRRQQYRRLRRAGTCAAGSTIAGALTVIAIVLGVILVAGVLLLAAVVLAVRARQWVGLAGRSRVGARAENEVQRALAPLQAEGWRLRHSLPLRGRGDIESIAVAPTGIAFVIETKASRYELEHLARTREMAVWLGTRRRRWCPRGAIPLCVWFAHAGSSALITVSSWCRETGWRLCCGSGRARVSVQRSSPRQV